MAALGRRPPRIEDPPPRTPLDEILRAARWAPSGDNVQPWRFEVLGADSVRVHLSGHAADNVYEYCGGEPTLLAGGVLLESLRVAASGWGRRMAWQYEGAESEGAAHRIRVDFIPADDVQPDPLIAQLMLRSVDRGRYRTRKLTAAEKQALEQAAGPGIQLEWHETARERLSLAWLGAKATDIRLRAPETYAVHKRMLDFKRGHSPDGIPAGAIGLDRFTLRIMRWAMESQDRLRLLNRLGGTWSVAAQLDLLTGLASAAFFTMRFGGPTPAPHLDAPAERTLRLLQAGQDIQRFWLQATRLGLAVQPALAILAFTHHGESAARFTADDSLQAKAKRLAAAFRARLGAGPEAFVFLGRIGEPSPKLPLHRSTRRRLAELMRATPAGA